MFKLISGQLQ